MEKENVFSCTSGYFKLRPICSTRTKNRKKVETRENCDFLIISCVTVRGRSTRKGAKSRKKLTWPWLQQQQQLISRFDFSRSNARMFAVFLKIERHWKFFSRDFSFSLLMPRPPKKCETFDCKNSNFRFFRTLNKTSL